MKTIFLGTRLVLPLLLLFAGSALAEDAVDFNRDVRPLLSDKCYACHGPDADHREAGLRLDVRDEALAELPSGAIAIVPGEPEASALVERIFLDDPDLRMPPAHTNKSLSDDEKQLLKRWIAEGAVYRQHWAFRALERPAIPTVSREDWARGAIDHFVLARLEREGLSPSPPADRRTLIRRLSFDLVGLPPTPEQVEAFLADSSEQAYEHLVDRLLKSEHFGERLAILWLDLVRYADTVGIHGDQPMSVSPYRDYVIDSFNQNKPFDQFTIEQLAGDLLPEPSLEQQVASGYNCLNMKTAEGGAQAKEYLAKYAADRVRTTSVAWLGATMGCAECHDHKFDPFTTRDFYSFAAFFADIEERGVYSGASRTGAFGPEMPVPTERQREELARLDRRIAELQQTLDTPTGELAQAQRAWERSLPKEPRAWTVLESEQPRSEGGAVIERQEDGSYRVSGKSPEKDVYRLPVSIPLERLTGLRLEILPDDSLPAKGPGRAGNGNFVLNEIRVKVGNRVLPWKRAEATFSQDGFPVAHTIDGKPETGWAILPQAGKAQTAVFVLEAAHATPGDSPLSLEMEFQYGGSHTLGRFRISATSREPEQVGLDDGLPAEVSKLLSVDESERTEPQREQLAAYYRSIAPALAPVREQLAGLQKHRETLASEVQTTLVTRTVEPRTMRILPRGNWMDDSGPVVQPAVPEFLSRGVNEDQRRLNRLDLARWIVSPDNPLTARAFVNRLWKLYFGEGLSPVLDDLGGQGKPPTHPELLDWLAAEFVESGWDIKHMVKLMVTSATYRQSSVVDPKLRARDPYNRLLARQARFRLDAELVRDNALAVSGLLVREVGGPSAKPYQPAGYYAQLNFPRRTYQADDGAMQYRRGLYTHWQRTFLHPMLRAFDAPSREECTAERARSNTPLAALVLLNDPTFVEAARVFAQRMIREGGDRPEQRIGKAFEIALGREPREAEVKTLRDLAEKHRTHYAGHPEAAKELLAVGQAPMLKDADPAELAAWTSVARTILSLHETITRP